MIFIAFILGVILGVLVRDIKYHSVEKIKELIQEMEARGATQFIQPVSPEEAFNQSDNVEQFINKSQ